MGLSSPQFANRGLSDLHRHLDGSLRKDTVMTLAEGLGLSVPASLSFHAGMGLADALSRFSFTLSLLQSPAAVTRVAHEICEDAHVEGVTTLEVRFAPQLHRGGDVDEIIAAALSGIAGRAGLIVCGLYGESPSDVSRLVEVGSRFDGVVGLDLAGGPSPEHRWSLIDYSEPFQHAAYLGLGRTVHAAEGRDVNEIRVAIEHLGAQRIGHGTTLLDDPSIVELVISRGVTIEACPTSNWHVGAIKTVDTHPLPKWIERGVKVCLNSDNTLFSGVNSADEHEWLTRLPVITDTHVNQVIEWGHVAAFCSRIVSRGGQA